MLSFALHLQSQEQEGVRSDGCVYPHRISDIESRGGGGHVGSKPSTKKHI